MMRIEGKWLAGLPAPATLGVALAQDPPQIYSQRGATCHSADLAGSDRGPSLARSRMLPTRSADQIRKIIHNGTPGGMPPFALPENECAQCHTAMGRGKSIGPDLSNIGRQIALPDLSRELRNPNAHVSGSYLQQPGQRQPPRFARSLQHSVFWTGGDAVAVVGTASWPVLRGTTVDI